MTTALIAIAAAALMFGLVVDTPERHERRMRAKAKLQFSESLLNRKGRS